MFPVKGLAPYPFICHYVCDWPHSAANAMLAGEPGGSLSKAAGLNLLSNFASGAVERSQPASMTTATFCGSIIQPAAVCSIAANFTQASRHDHVLPKPGSCVTAGFQQIVLGCAQYQIVGRTYDL